MDNKYAFDIHRIFFGDAPYAFLLEILLRTVIMYAYTIFLLRILGKRGMGQLSTLELAIIISFGSAVGDPMMGVDVPIVHGLLVITTVAVLQIGMEKVINKHKKLENVMEGTPDCLVDSGVINLENLKKNELSHEDLLRSLRASQVDHLGQINKAIFETSGVISVLFLPPKKIRPGLSALPQDLIPKSWFITATSAHDADAYYSCNTCAYTVQSATSLPEKCDNCGEKCWVKSDDTSHEN
jgi:uncharacterized membrane protein YcaP (DUF421 family)